MTTDQKIKYFVSECDRFIDFFGLHEWQVFYDAHGHEIGARAMCTTSGIIDNASGDGMQAALSYDIGWLSDKRIDKREISICAFHEVLELMLCKLRDYAYNQTMIIHEREIDDEVHRIIRRFENKIYPLI